MAQRHRVDRLEQVQAGQHAEQRERQQRQDLAPLDVCAIFESMACRRHIVEKHDQWHDQGQR